MTSEEQSGEPDEPERTVFDFEIGSYAREIARLREDVGRGRQEVLDGGNLTHYALGLSNRGNMILVGMCSLVEALLMGIALEGATSNKDAEKIRGMGRGNLVKRLEPWINFDDLESWAAFDRLVKVRNAIVHGYGGIVPTRRVKALKEALGDLDIPEVLVGDRRIRMNSAALESAHATVAGLIRELLDHRANRGAPGGPR